MTLQPVVDSLLKILTDILGFLPHFVNGLIILTVGYLISALLRIILRFVFRQIRLTQLADRLGITAAMGGLGVRASLAEILVQVVFFFLLLSFSTSAVRLMGLSAVADLLANVLFFLPRAISAALIVIFGSMLARFLGTTIKSVSERVNITYSNALGKIIEYTIVAFVVVLAISTLGVDTTILTTSLTILIASTGLAIALTFTLGAREAARHVIAGLYVRQQIQPGQQIRLGEYEGTVLSTSGAYTVLETSDEAGKPGTIALPNAMLLEQAVVSQETQASAQEQEG